MIGNIFDLFVLFPCQATVKYQQSGRVWLICIFQKEPPQKHQKQQNWGRKSPFIQI